MTAKIGYIKVEVFEKKQAIESIVTLIKARYFFIGSAVLQVLLLMVLGKNLTVFTIPKMALLAIVAFSYNFFYWLYVRRSPEKISDQGLKIVKFFQIPLDLLAIAGVLWFNGTVTVFTSAFFLVSIMMASAVYRKQGIALAAFGVVAIYGSLAILEYYGLMPEASSKYYSSIKGNFEYLKRMLTIFYCYVAGATMVAGYLSALQGRRERSLLEQRNELAEKANDLTKQATELTNTKNWLNEALVKSDKMRIQADEARFNQETEKNKVSAVIQNLIDGLIMVDQDGVVTLINKKAEKMLGLKKEKVIGRRLQESENNSLVKISYLLNTEQEQLRKKEISISQEPEEILELNTADVVDVKGKILGQLIVLHDVTREKAVDRMKSEFVTIAAHQLRTPLSAVKWSLNLVLSGDLGRVAKKQKETLQKGYQSNERMIILINDLLNIARIEEGRFVFDLVRVSLSDLVQESIDELKEFASKKEIKVEFEKPKDRFEIMVDKEKMKLALYNLVENAINYSRLNSVVNISLKSEKGSIVFSVKDQGGGISKNQQSRLFAKFSRGADAIKMNTEGTGLGLFIVKNVIEGHGGRVWYETEEEKGSTFYFLLPISK